MNVDSNNLKVYWPRGERAVQSEPIAPRLASLEGKTIAFAWDYLFRGDEIFPLIERELAARYPALRFVNYDVFGSTHGEDEQRILVDLPHKLRDLDVHALISGMGC